MNRQNSSSNNNSLDILVIGAAVAAAAFLFARPASPKAKVLAFTGRKLRRRNHLKLVASNGRPVTHLQLVT